jgi:hypothetical protein
VTGQLPQVFVFQAMIATGLLLARNEDVHVEMLKDSK